MSLRSLLFAVAAFAGLAIATEADARVTNAAVNMHSGPGASYGLVTTVPAGVDVSFHGCSGHWCSITFNGRRGWIAANYLSGTGYNRDIGVAGPTPGCPIPRNYVLYAQGLDKRTTRGCPLDFYTFPYGSKPYFDSQYYHSNWHPRGFN
jgi:hypothetical protein